MPITMTSINTQLDLMTQYRIVIIKYFTSKGYDSRIQNIGKARDLFEQLPEQDTSVIDSFYRCIKKYLGEKFLEEIYFDLFYQFIWKNNRITKKEFYEMELETRCRFVYKSIPNHAKNTFQLFFRGFVVIHLLNKQSFKNFADLHLVDDDSLSIIKQFSHA